MKWWKKSAKTVNKSILYMVESYIMFVVGMVLLGNTFNLEPLHLWGIFILFFLSIQLNNKQFLTYFMVIILLIIGVFFLDIPFITWLIFVSIFIWRFFVVALIDEIDNGVFGLHIFIYIGLTILYFILHAFFSIPFSSNTILTSYLYMFVLYILSGFIQQLEKATFNKNLTKSLSIQLGIIAFSITLILALFYLTKKPILSLYSLVKEGITTIFIYITTIIYTFFLNAMSNIPDERKGIFYELLSRNEEGEEKPDLSIPFVETPSFWIYFERFMVFVLFLLFVFFIYKLFKRIGIKQTIPIQTTVRITEEELSFLRKQKSKPYISANIYRKLYQQFIMWLIQKKKLPSKQQLTSSKINELVSISYPSLTLEMKEITVNYQRIRYGNHPAVINEKEYKALIKHIKSEIKASDKEKR